MKLSPKFLVLPLAVSGLIAQSATALITIDSVHVGNAGNAADQNYSGQGAFGSVGYNYSISKYEVTLIQYNGFLNSVAKTDTYGLYNTELGLNPNIMGISRSGSSGNYTYSVIGSGNRPVTYVSWFDAARFVNWLHNGQPTGAQGAGTTETGAYTLNGAMTGNAFNRNANWQYGIPSRNEWYKAAYHQPSTLGGDTDNFWYYPTSSNNPPNSRNGSASDPNSANFFQNDGIANGFNDGWAVTGSTSYPDGLNVLTDVGSFQLADSYYGTYDQGGNVWEWTDGTGSGTREIRGGSWGNSGVLNLSASNRLRIPAETSFDDVGFRVVIVPEPTLAGLMTLGIALLAWRRK